MTPLTSRHTNQMSQFLSCVLLLAGNGHFFAFSLEMHLKSELIMYFKLCMLNSLNLNLYKRNILPPTHFMFSGLTNHMR